MRLIDADKAYEDLISIIDRFMDWPRVYYETIGKRRIISAIFDEQATVFDIDKVIEQLEDERLSSYADFDKYVEEVSPRLDAEYDDLFHIGISRAIEVIKDGVHNDKTR